MTYRGFFEKINQYVEQIAQDRSDAQLLQELVFECLPYFLYLRIKFGFQKIQIEEIKEELAFEAINEAFIHMERRNLSYAICLQNAFRDCCRRRIKILYDKILKDLIEQNALKSTEEYKPLLAEAQAERNELMENVNSILDRHDLFSKKVIFEKMGGSTYPGMAQVFDTTPNECKRVYWHDIYHIRKNIKKGHQ